jgi:uncharacterized protein
MTARSDALRVAVVDLLRQPGLQRSLHDRVPIDQLEIEAPRVVGAAVDLDAVIESNINGLEVSGSVTMAVQDQCRRCLRPLVVDTELEIDERYLDEADGDEPDPGSFDPQTGYLDLTTVVRDLVLIGLVEPPPLCSPDCAGFCAVCGADRNQVACGCGVEQRDERWSALDQLRGDVPESPDSSG